MAASKQASKHTHACAQCSPASVGLAQACPNKINAMCIEHTTVQWVNGMQVYFAIQVLGILISCSSIEGGFSPNKCLIHKAL